MATAKITVDEGTTTNIATNSFTEDAVTKHVNRSVLNSSAGAEIGTSSSPIQVTLANTGANTSKLLVTPDLPSGAATSAKQPALGTAGSASTDVLTIQGVASMTKLLVTPDLPSGASTAAKQPALGVAGTASSDVLTVQGIASMTALKVDGSAATQPVSGTFWQATQPVSGTVTANIGTSGSLALDASVTGLEVAQGSTTLGQKGTLTQAAVTTAAPTYTTAQTAPLSLTTTGLLRVDNSGVTQPVSGTFWQATQPVSLASVPSHAVTNAGTFATQATLQTQTDTIMVGGVNIKEINAVTPLMGNGVTGTGSQRVTLSSDNTALATWGQGATGAAVPSGAQYKGGLAQTALPTAATAGNLTGALMDKFGRQVIVTGTVRDLRATQTTTISASTTETTIVTAGAAGVFNDLISIVVSNTSAATNTRIDFRDATAGTIIFSLQSPGNTTLGFSLPGVSIPQTTAANNWTAQCSASTTDIRILAIYEKNK